MLISSSLTHISLFPLTKPHLTFFFPLSFLLSSALFSFPRSLLLPSPRFLSFLSSHLTFFSLSFLSPQLTSPHPTPFLPLTKCALLFLSLITSSLTKVSLFPFLLPHLTSSSFHFLSSHFTSSHLLLSFLFLHLTSPTTSLSLSSPHLLLPSLFPHLTSSPSSLTFFPLTKCAVFDFGIRINLVRRRHFYSKTDELPADLQSTILRPKTHVHLLT